MKITSIETDFVSIKLKKPFKTALREISAADIIIIKVVTDTEEIGYGSAAPTAVITGDINESIVGAIKNYIEPKIIGMNIDELEIITGNIQNAAVNNTSAKAAVDMAVYDLFAKKYNMPLYKYFGGAKREIETDITISVNSPEEMANDAINYVKDGFSTLKTKVGVDAKLDILRVKAIRDAVGYDVKIRLDANQGWGSKEAVRTIRSMEDMGLVIELVEQPVLAHDLEGLKYVTDNVETLIMADESLFSPYDCFNLLKNRAVDILNIKLMKCGGLNNAQKINAMAESCGVECMMGCMIESKIGIAAAAHFAGGKLNITKADLDAIALFEEDPILGGVELIDNKLIIADKKGLGIYGIKQKEEWVSENK